VPARRLRRRLRPIPGSRLELDPRADRLRGLVGAGRPVVDLRWANDPSGASERLRAAAADPAALRELVAEGIAGASALDALTREDADTLIGIIAGPSVIPRRTPLDLDLPLDEHLRLVVPFGPEALSLAAAVILAARARIDEAVETCGRPAVTGPAALVQAVVVAGADRGDAVAAHGEVDVYDDITAVTAMLGAVGLRDSGRDREALGTLDSLLRHDALSPAVLRLCRLERARTRQLAGDVAGARDDLEQLLNTDGRDIAAREALAGLRSVPPSSDAAVMPESIELAAKERLVRSLEAELVEAEVALATLEAELDAFAGRHHDALGDRYVRLDELVAQEAAVRAARGDVRARRAADAARERAAATADAVQAESEKPATSAPPTDDLKRVYRDLARRIHPDFAADDRDRAERERVMAAVNEAYARGDAAALARLAAEWGERPEDVPGSDVGAGLVRSIRAAVRLRVRLDQVVDAHDTLMASPLGQLHRQVVDAAAHGHDLLTEMAAELDDEIADAERRLADLDAVGGGVR
jgi:hypothetical protein